MALTLDLSFFETGLCRDAVANGADSDDWSYERLNIGKAEQKVRRERAQAVCRRCPGQEACRAYALDDPELHGIWGGMTKNAREIYQTGKYRKFINGRRVTTEVKV